VDLSVAYKQQVFDAMIAAYTRGETPNPDVACNEFIKFGFFLSYAESLGADYVATGHYAQITTVDAKQCLEIARDTEKDQSYFLAHIEPSVLSRVLFPIGHLRKSEVRKIAKKKGLPTHNRRDSQGLCFVGHLDMKDFLRQTVAHTPGTVFDESGRAIGVHDGAALYTLGERHGFTLATESSDRAPMYVIQKDLTTNSVTVSSQHRVMSKLSIQLKDMKWFLPADNFPMACKMRFRYRQPLLDCQVDVRSSDIYVTTENLSDMPSVGQLLALYKDSNVVGSGIIARAIES
jgi:tRNA-specific 2-thiouridylase